MDGVQKENLTEDCRSTKRSLMKTGSAFFGQWDQDKFVHPLVGVKHRGVSAAWVQKVLRGMTSTDDTRRDRRWSTILDDEMTRSLQNWVRKAWWRFKAQWKGGGEKREVKTLGYFKEKGGGMQHFQERAAERLFLKKSRARLRVTRIQSDIKNNSCCVCVNLWSQLTDTSWMYLSRSWCIVVS